MHARGMRNARCFLSNCAFSPRVIWILSTRTDGIPGDRLNFSLAPSPPARSPLTRTAHSARANGRRGLRLHCGRRHCTRILVSAFRGRTLQREDRCEDCGAAEGRNKNIVGFTISDILLPSPRRVITENNRENNHRKIENKKINKCFSWWIRAEYVPALCSHLAEKSPLFDNNNVDIIASRISREITSEASFINFSLAAVRELFLRVRAEASREEGRRGWRRGEEGESAIRKIAVDVVETGEAVKQTVRRRASFSRI